MNPTVTPLQRLQRLNNSRWNITVTPTGPGGTTTIDVSTHGVTITVTAATANKAALIVLDAVTGHEQRLNTRHPSTGHPFPTIRPV